MILRRITLRPRSKADMVDIAAAATATKVDGIIVSNTTIARSTAGSGDRRVCTTTLLYSAAMRVVCVTCATAHWPMVRQGDLRCLGC